MSFSSSNRFHFQTSCLFYWVHFIPSLAFHFRVSVYDGYFVFTFSIQFKPSHGINELNFISPVLHWAYDIGRPLYFLICKTFSIWKIFFIPTILNNHLEATTRFRSIYNVANNTLIGFHSDILFACSLFANKRKHM